MTLLLTNDEVDRLLDMRECLDVFESAYRELGQGIGVTRTVSQVFTPTRHSTDALYSFKSMDGVAPFLDVAAIRRNCVETTDGIRIPLHAVCRCVRGRDVRRGEIAGASWMLWPPP